MKNRCTDENQGKQLHQYELGMLSDEDRKAFELHLYDCESCLADAQELWEESRLIRHDPEARRTIANVLDRTGRSSIPADHDPKPGPQRKWKSILRMTMAAAAVIALLVLKPWQIDIKPTDHALAAEFRLIVMGFENIQNPDDPDRLGEVIANLVMTDLSESAFLQVVSPERLSDTRKLIQHGAQPPDSDDAASQMAEHTGARWILSGDIFQDHQVTTITSRLLEYPGLRLVATQKASGPSDQTIFSLIDRLTIEIKKDLSLPTAALDEADPPVGDITTHFPQAYLRYLEGVDFINRMYTQEAVEAFEACLAIDSSYAMAYYNLSRLVDGRLIHKAMEHVDHATHRDSYYIRSQAALIQGDIAGSKVLLEELLDRYPDEKDALLTLGLRAYEDGQYQEAIRFFVDILEIDPLNRSANNMLSYSYDAIGDLGKAIEAINSYIALTPNEPNPYDSRGDLLARNGLIDEAIESYQMALAKRPDFRAAQENLGHMYIFQGRFEEATEQYHMSIEDRNVPYLTMSQLNFALIPIRLGLFDEALEAIDSAIVVSRDDAERLGVAEPSQAHFLKFWVHLELGQLDLAVRDAETCVHLADLAHPDNNIYYRWTLAYALALNGDHQRADSIIAAVEKHYAQNPSTPIALYWCKGMVALARHDGKTAVPMLEKGVEGYTAQTKFMGMARLGLVYLEAGMYEEAVAALEPTTRVLGYQRLIDGVYGVKVHYLLGQAYEGVGEYALAAEQYMTFLDLWNNADPALASVSDARARLGKLKITP